MPGVPDTPVGAPGTVAGVTAFEAVDAGPEPLMFLAVTVKVYAVPLVSPVTVADVVVPFAVVTEIDPGDDVTA